MPVIDEETAQTETMAPPVEGVQPRTPAPARWPALMLAAVGGVLAGMLLILALTLFSGPRVGPGSPGNPSADWDSTIMLNDAYLTAQAKAGGSGQIQDPKLHAGADGKVTMTGKVNILGAAAPLTVILQPTIVDGELRMTVVTAQVGRLALPEPIARDIEKTIASAMEPPPTKVATTLVRVEAREGELVLYAKVK
jgi:hypothetical protein